MYPTSFVIMYPLYLPLYCLKCFRFISSLFVSDIQHIFSISTVFPVSSFYWSILSSVELYPAYFQYPFFFVSGLYYTLSCPVSGIVYIALYSALLHVDFIEYISVFCQGNVSGIVYIVLYSALLHVDFIVYIPVFCLVNVSGIVYTALYSALLL